MRETRSLLLQIKPASPWFSPGSGISATKRRVVEDSDCDAAGRIARRRRRGVNATDQVGLAIAAAVLCTLTGYISCL